LPKVQAERDWEYNLSLRLKNKNKMPACLLPFFLCLDDGPQEGFQLSFWTKDVPTVRNTVPPLPLHLYGSLCRGDRAAGGAAENNTKIQADE